MEKWSFREDNALIELYSVCGFQWITISRMMGTKSAYQCAQRWRNALQPGIDTNPFALLERDAVKELYRIHGARWARISLCLPGRTPKMVKAIWEQMQAEEERIRVQMSIPRLLN
ncbi:8850_t:CDS:2 [Paraglomus brasilianum]|uniref:8850_t:CDS:1 n=1 Tax=Paraglomus brasilianum TaxID=144538 RepID=A0A9N9CTI0_9GLOM|nr:8850_t:CDS:2 [Paraglomus brasilianum]